MKLLYFATIDFFAKPNPGFHLMYSMIQDLLSNGVEIFYVGCSLNGINNHIPYDLEKNPNFHYDLVSVESVPKSKFVRRYMDGINYARKAKKKISKVIKKCDLAFIQSSPTVLYNVCVVRKLSKTIKIVYNIQDMFPGSSIASGVMPQKWMQKIFYSLQKIAYKQSDIIVAISEDMKTKLIDQGVPKEKIRVIVNWFDDKSVHKVEWEDNRFVKKYNLSKNTFYVQYAGTMGYVFDYKMVLNVAEKLVDYKDIEIQMIGMGSQKEAFQKEALNKGLSNIKFLPLEPQEMVSDVYSACSVCLIPLKQGIIGNSVPSKAGLLMECKKAIVTSSDQSSFYNRMINDNQLGFAKSTNDVDGIVESILFLKNHPDENIKMGENGYKYGHFLYSRSQNIELYLKLFYSVVRPSKQ